MAAEFSKFSQTQKELLVEAGGVIISSYGESILDLAKRDKKFWTTGKNENLSDLTFAHFPSLRSEIAIFPDNLYLRKSNNKTIQEQKYIVEVYEEKIREYSGLESIRAVLGDTPTHAVVAFEYQAETGKRLHGRDYFYPYARTENPRNIKPRIVDVGFFSEDNALGINFHPDKKHPVVYAAPLILPNEI